MSNNDKIKTGWWSKAKAIGWATKVDLAGNDIDTLEDVELDEELLARVAASLLNPSGNAYYLSDQTYLRLRVQEMRAAARPLPTWWQKPDPVRRSCWASRLDNYADESKNEE